MANSALYDISTLSPGDHLCCIYQTEQEHRAVLSPYVKNGLVQNQKVLYIVDAHTAQTVLDYFSETGFDVQKYLDSGQLVILDRHETYIRNDTFDPKAMIELLKSEEQKALEEGYEALRITGEMTWALHGHPGSERLIEYENLLNGFIPYSKCMAICQYDKRRFSPEILMDILRTHPKAFVGTEMYNNFYYMPPEKLMGDNPELSELDHWISNLQRHAEAEQKLEREKKFTDAILETSGAIILVIKPDGFIERVNKTCEQISGYTQEELQRDKFYEKLLLEDEREAVKGVFQKLLNGNYPSRHENYWLGKNGEKRLIAWTNTIVPDEQGNVDLVISAGIDITERMEAEKQKVEKLKEEINWLENFTQKGTTSITGRSYAQKTLRERYPEYFKELQSDYKEVLNNRLDERVHKVNHHISQRLQSIAQHLGRNEAGPRDIVELHTRALKDLNQGAAYKKAQAINEEGRFLALELMGYLVTFYRNLTTAKDRVN